MQKRVLAALFSGCLLTASHIAMAASAASDSYPIKQLVYIGQSILANSTEFDHVPVGGLSGIDYDNQHHRWLMVSDDRAVKGPARAYWASMSVTDNKVGEMHITQQINLKQMDGSLYPNVATFMLKGKGAVPDLESIRLTPDKKAIRYTSEGDRKIGLNPFIRQAKLNGDYVADIAIANVIKLQKNRGFRDNLALEGSSFTPDGQHYFISVEAPLLQDDPLPNTHHGARIRLFEYNHDNKLEKSSIYRVDPWPAAPGKGKNADNGVSEILAIDNHHLLVLERSGIENDKGVYHDYIRIYQVDLTHAPTVDENKAALSKDDKAVHKKLLLDLNSLPVRLDNIEGISFGPTLKDGSQSLVVISDNNFNDSEITQLLAFKVRR
ncbi:esterase-like activity of phytase family protein [Celerinatantimonas sp. MCCC 1A17872]|uniref:esterase-like activity of phytase family protein n=1 Tax=Celerinatantimonas sp. MCCC 1A17872 TaxID=3177514 RepID=UPI0038BF869F